MNKFSCRVPFSAFSIPKATAVCTVSNDKREHRITSIPSAPYATNPTAATSNTDHGNHYRAKVRPPSFEEVGTGVWGPQWGPGAEPLSGSIPLRSKVRNCMSTLLSRSKAGLF